MKNLPFLLFALCILGSCTDDGSVDCSTVSCEGPPTLAFEVILDGENVFEEGLFTVEDITVGNTAPMAITLTINETNFGSRTTQILFLETTAWEATTYNFDLNIGDDFTSNIDIEIALSSGGCCSGIPLIANYEIDGVIQVNPRRVAVLNLD